MFVKVIKSVSTTTKLHCNTFSYNTNRILGLITGDLETWTIYHGRSGFIKNRNGKHLTEAEGIKKNGKKTQKNCTKKIFMTKIITMV